MWGREFPAFALKVPGEAQQSLYREKEDRMNGHFIFALALVLFAFLLCYWFRKENKK